MFKKLSGKNQNKRFSERHLHFSGSHCALIRLVPDSAPIVILLKPTHNVTLKNENGAQKSARLDFFRSIFGTSKYMGHNFGILSDRKSKNDPATQKFSLYFSMIWQNRCDVKT